MSLKHKIGLSVMLSFAMFATFSHAQTGKTSGGTGGIQKEWAVIKGFRSARFGMREAEVLRAINKDFRISKNKVKRQEHPMEKTVSLGITVTDLLPESGEAGVFYVFGYKSKRLIQVNVLMGRPIAKNPNPAGIVTVANSLRGHFMKKRYKTESFVANAKLNDASVLVFKGQDKKDRMILLVLTNPQEEGATENKNISLRLSYIEKTDSPDVYGIKDGDF